MCKSVQQKLGYTAEATQYCDMMGSERLKFMYSEKAIKFCKTSTVDLSYVVSVKSTVEILQNFVAFSEYMNFKENKNKDTDGT